MGILMASLVKTSSPMIADKVMPMMPSLCLDRSLIPGLEGLQVDDEVTFEFKAKVVGVHKNEWEKGSGRIDFSLSKGEILSIDKEIRSVKAREKLKDGIRKLNDKNTMRGV